MFQDSPSVARLLSIFTRIAGFANCECSVCCDMFKENVEMAIANQRTKTIQKTKRKTTIKSQSSHRLPGLPILKVDKEKETCDNDNYKSKDKYIFSLAAGVHLER